MKEELTAYVTRYALTDGIFKVKGEVHHDISSKMFSYKLPGCFSTSVFGKD